MRLITIVLIALFSTVTFAKVEFVVNELTSDIQRPWAIAYIGSQSFVITERHGGLRKWHNGQLSKSIPLPLEVYDSAQGGLLDIHPHPNYPQNGWLYVTYSAGSLLSNELTLARFKLTNQLAVIEFKELFKATPSKIAGLHFAGRIAFLPDNTLVFGVGDGFNYDDEAQELNSHLGKIIRLKDDGSVPSDNPFVNTAGALPEIFSFGHRNPQGMFYDSKRQILFSNEHGPKGGDEINLLVKGNNYGWPEITYGVGYSGLKVSDFTAKDGMEQPLLHWTPSIAPSSLVVYQGEMFPELNGHILNTTLKYQELRLVKISNDAQTSNLKVASQHTYLKHLEQRFRDIELDEQGAIYLITDAGKLLKLTKN